MINRGAIIIHPKQPFLDWINDTVEMSSPVTMEELKDDCTVLLVPDLGSLEEIMEYVRPLKVELLEAELESWNLDPSTWPQERTEELFDAWLELRAHSEIWDLVSGPIAKEQDGMSPDLSGTWTVISSPDFDDDYLYMETTPYVKLSEEERQVDGKFQVGLIAGSLSGVVVGDQVQFTFEGMDEMEPVHGAGSIAAQGERMVFTLWFHLGDVFTFECEKSLDE